MQFLAFVPASALASAALALLIQPRAPQAPATAEAPAPTNPAAPAPVVGLAWADVDVDGYPDLIAAGAGGQAVLLRNLGDGSFADVTASYGLSQLSGLQHASWQDVDGDGLPDLLALRANGEARLLRHFGAFFQDATAHAGLAQSFAALEQRWLDYDRDGRADLLLVGGDRQQLYHNLGQATFEAFELPAPLDAPRAPDASTRNEGPSGPAAPAETAAGAQVGRPSAEGAEIDDVAAPGSRRAVPSGRNEELTSSSIGSVDSAPLRDPYGSQAAGSCAISIDDQASSGCINASSVPSLGQLYPLSSNLFVASSGFVGLGTTQPLARTHVVANSLGLVPAALAEEDMILEALQSNLGLFSRAGGTWGSALTLADVDSSGQLVDKWALARKATGGGGALHVTYGGDPNPATNLAVMTLTKTGSVGIGTTAPGSDRLQVLQTETSGVCTRILNGDKNNIQAALVVSHTGSGPGIIATSADSHGVQSYGKTAIHGIGTTYGVHAESNSGTPLFVQKHSGGNTTPAAIITSDVAGGALYIIPNKAAGGEAAFFGGRFHVGYFGGLGLPVGRVQIDTDSTNGGYVRCYNGAGTSTILLDGDSGGQGRITTDILEITGGADLVESFDTAEESVEPGTVLVIDSERAGELTLSTEPYDRRVAGVVSGAGGISPGLRMGQEGVASGDTPVALTGRVYVKASAENGSIRPGDRLTTAGTPGHAMRVTDAARADGAVIGKAMSTLDQGTGLVLVLVNLQ